nr:MAG TPA: hypothetical protein [Caudoviricetes sp.]
MVFFILMCISLVYMYIISIYVYFFVWGRVCLDVYD